MTKEIYQPDEIPAPGVPLKRRVDPQNQQLLRSEVEKRIERARAKLSQRDLRRLIKRYRQIQKLLLKYKYNQLIRERAEIAVEFRLALENARSERTRRAKNRAWVLAQRGKKIVERLKSLHPLAQEFNEIGSQLRTHAQIVKLENEERENRIAFRREVETWKPILEAVFRQHPKLHHIRHTSNGDEIIEIPILKKPLIRADKVYFPLKTSRQTFWQRLFGKWSSALPYGVNISDLISPETLLNMSVLTGREVTVERSPKTQNIFYVINRLDAAGGLPSRVLFGKVIDFYPLESHSKTPWIAGVDGDGKVWAFDFDTFPHVLIAGASGGGKSTFINQMIALLVQMNLTDELAMAFIDNKGGIELHHFEKVPHQLMKICKSIENVVPSLTKIREMMQKRFKVFYEADARSLASYNERVQHESRLPRVIVVVDEMATLAGLGDTTKEIHFLLRDIASQGRAVGIHLVLCTQYPTVDILPGWVKANATLRICFKMPNHTASQVVVDSVTAALLPDVPGRLVARLGGREIILQAPFIDDSGIAIAVSNALKNAPRSTQPVVLPESEGDLLEVRAPAPRLRFGRDDLIELTLEHLGGKLSASNSAKLVDPHIATLSALRKLVGAIISDWEQTGVIEHRGKLYTLKKVKGRGSYVMCEVVSETDFQDKQHTEEMSDTSDRSDT